MRTCLRACQLCNVIILEQIEFAMHSVRNALCGGFLAFVLIKACVRAQAQADAKVVLPVLYAAVHRRRHHHHFCGPSWHARVSVLQTEHLHAHAHETYKHTHGRPTD